MAGTSIDNAKCNGCGACVKACPNSVYILSNGKAKKEQPDRCNPIDCVKCVYACPEKAIMFKY